MESVAAYLPDDQLFVMALLSKTLATAILPENSGVWKAHFLSHYDYPHITGPYDFRVAYQLRRLVLRNFIGFGMDTNMAKVQLEILRDMVLGRKMGSGRDHRAC